MRFWRPSYLLVALVNNVNVALHDAVKVLCQCNEVIKRLLKVEAFRSLTDR
jgi:hypothetical protein